jgi:nitrate reductase delta subunit
MKTYVALSALLSYPDEGLIEALPQIARALAEEDLVPPAVLSRLNGLMGELCEQDLYTVQERYVSLFDRSRALSLHLFEHVHGESRDRGQAMVDLARLYRDTGLQVIDHELPDYLPAFLEYLSLLPGTRARGLLGETSGILRSLHGGLARRDSCYAAVLETLLLLAGETVSEPCAHAREAEPDSPEALDREWAEEPVAFGGPCSAPKPALKPVQIHRQGLPV